MVKLGTIVAVLSEVALGMNHDPNTPWCGVRSFKHQLVDS